MPAGGTDRDQHEAVKPPATRHEYFNGRCKLERWYCRVALATFVGLFPAFGTNAGQDASRQVLAFYYGWYGNPVTSARWVHWKNADPAYQRIENSTDYPAYGAYDSHDPATVDRQAAAAHSAGVTGFIASWWGQGSFEDHGMPLLLDAADRHGLAVSAYYEKIGGREAAGAASGDTAASRINAAVADLGYLLTHYGVDKAWLRVDGRPVVFVYGRALRQLSPAEWQDVIAQIRHDKPGGVTLVADTSDPKYVAVFDGASSYNITSQTQHKTSLQIQDWARAAYPKMVAAAGAGKISTVTVIPGYDDSKLGRPSPRPITQRWGGETYRTLWQEAVVAAPDYVLITSWNEWHEGSEIEPSVEYGSVMLNDTAIFAREFLAGRR
jgi:glycoprotein endo-alpha-1,2-mannosidase